MYPAARSLLPRGSLCRCFSAFAPEAIFNEENIEKTIRRFSKIQSVKTHSSAPADRNAAVLIPVCVIGGEVSLLYTLRAATLKSHKGQVSFPGGMEDAADKSAEETAIRETREELGVGEGLIEVWGKGNAIDSRGRASVLPVIGALNIQNLQHLDVNRSEVTEVFTVPLRVLCDEKFVRHTQFRSNYSLPVFTGGKRKIWGLTAIITHLFLKCLLPEDYTCNIKYIPPLKSKPYNRYM